MATLTKDTPLTDRQRELLRMLYDFAGRRGRYPTYREIRAAMSIKSPNGIAWHLRSLGRKGYVTFEARGSYQYVRLAGVELRPQLVGEAGERLGRVLGEGG